MPVKSAEDPESKYPGIKKKHGRGTRVPALATLGRDDSGGNGAMQVIAAPWHDDVALRIAYALEQSGAVAALRPVFQGGQPWTSTCRTSSPK